MERSVRVEASQAPQSSAHSMSASMSSSAAAQSMAGRQGSVSSRTVEKVKSTGTASEAQSRMMTAGTTSRVTSASRWKSRFRSLAMLDTLSMRANEGDEATANKTPCYVLMSRIIVESKFFVGLTTILTVWALTGDDLRLVFTEEPADKWFIIIVIVMLVVFSFEVVISCIGRDDYFMSFFFILDVISTLTLVLDLPAVSEWIEGTGEDDGDMNSLKSGRTARLGAKAGRIVRVIRLVRILKLYKAFLEARAQKKRQQEMQDGDEDDWDEVDVKENQEHLPQKESRVGKRLSEMTTRRVIILVLSMLLVLPQLEAESSEQLGTSAQYGVDNLWQHLSNTVSLPNSEPVKEKFEWELLKYIFYHNWYADHGYCTGEGLACANRYFSHLFWVGIMAPDDKIEKVLEVANQAKVSKKTVDRWVDTWTPRSNDIYVYGTMPPEALIILHSPWNDACNIKDRVRQGFSLIGPDASGVVDYVAKCPENLRTGERRKISPRLLQFDQLQDWYLVFYFDLRPFTRADAAYNLAMTGFICVVLCTAAMMFASDANKLVLHPVERMVKRVDAIRRDPLIAMKMADEEFKLEEMAKAKLRHRARRDVAKQAVQSIYKCDWLKRSEEPMETTILEKTIIKLGSLLALGFGEAGANIIGQNMRGSDTAGVNAMVPGSSVECVMGLARIRNFSIANEVLKTKIMHFVNQIAEIVHGVVDNAHGAANKNNGDTFLIIWRLEEVEQSKRSRCADLALLAFSQVLGALHASPLLAEYRAHPGLQMRLGAGVRVNLSFAVHCGWAIEGAVGSEFKIDASYLSPNVSIVNSMEHATQTYGVPLIVADSVVALCTAPMAELCRLMDRVIVTGSIRPMQLYSLDLDYMSVEVDMRAALQMTWNSRNRFKARQFLENEKTNKWKDDFKVESVFQADPNLKTMREQYTEEFFQQFNMGYQNYSQGEWAVARRLLTETQSILGVEDGPSTALLRYMEIYQYESPKDWEPPGKRELDQVVCVVSV
mmetsp:Transcript_37630/g.66914  ORF Transcript_37630/g.66914 Transcript_37630/m.66914 type:complete len:1000 (+) Transcript_37630:70-3069(+)